MNYFLIVEDSALNDINRYAKWYNKKQHNLGVKFADCIFKCIEEIEQKPFASPSKYKKTREKFAKKFPYMIIFSVEDEKIIIEKVFPCKKNSSKKYKNLK